MFRTRTLPLSKAIRAVAVELQDLLAKENRDNLAAQVPSLEIIDRCRRGDDFCAAFYIQPKTHGPYGPSHECIELEPIEGMLILDVIDPAIAYGESCIETKFGLLCSACCCSLESNAKFPT